MSREIKRPLPSLPRVRSGQKIRPATNRRTLDGEVEASIIAHPRAYSLHVWRSLVLLTRHRGPSSTAKEDARMAKKTKAEPVAMLAMRIPASMKKALSDHAWATRRTMADVLREVIAGYLGKAAAK